MTETNWDPQKLRQAGVEPRHLARLLGIHPVTGSTWLCGRAKPSSLLGVQAQTLMVAVDNALAETALPIAPDRYPADEHSVRTLAALKRYYRQAQEGQSGT
jgi:hypothetical protein